MPRLDADDRALLETSVARFVEDNLPENAEFVEEVSHWNTFAELGWLALPLSERSGGLGGSPHDVQVLCRAFGRGLIKEPFLESAVLAARILDELEPGSERLAQMITGEVVLILANEEAGFDNQNIRCTVTSNDNQLVLSGNKSMVMHANKANGYLVTALQDGQLLLVCVPSECDGLVVENYPTIDNQPAADLRFKNVVLDENWVVAEGKDVTTAISNASLYTICCLAAELDGIAEQARTLTAQYMITREQFGEKLADFQALQHIFADMVMVEEELRGIAWMTANAWDMEDVDERENMLRASKARMGDIARAMLESAVQLHGGVGVSEEFILGAYLRRTITIDAMLGDAGQHRRWQAQRYLEAVS